MKFDNTIPALLLLLGHQSNVVSSQDIIFQANAPSGTQFRGVYEMGGYVYASANDYLMKYTLNGDLVMQKNVGEGNILGQISALDSNTIVVNPGRVNSNEGIQAFQTSDLSRIWNNSALGSRGAATQCAPLVVTPDSSGEQVAISGFSPTGSTSVSPFASFAGDDGSTVWAGSSNSTSRPCGTLSPDGEILYVSSSRQIIAYNVTSGEELDASAVGDIPGSLGAGVAISEDGLYLYISTLQGVMRFNASNLSSSTLLVTDRRTKSVRQSPILSGSTLYIHASTFNVPGGNIISAYNIVDDADKATEIWRQNGFSLNLATFALFADESTILAPRGSSAVALNASSGEELWRTSLDASTVASVLYINDAGNRAYIGSNKLSSIEIGSGTVSPAPTPNPSASPTKAPSNPPSPAPTKSPSVSPTLSPTISAMPSSSPSASPSFSPTISQEPSASPTISAQPSSSPSVSPSMTPSSSPSMNPSLRPSGSPSLAPNDSSSSGRKVYSNKYVLTLAFAVGTATLITGAL